METKLKTVAMSRIHPYANNPRDNEGRPVDDVAESIRQCGYITPIIVDEAGIILAGHTRFYALTELGATEVQVIEASGLSEEQKKKFRILDNRTNELAYWDYTKLLQELDGLDFNKYSFGFEKLTDKMDQDIDTGIEFDLEDFDDEKFIHECPECGFRFN